MRIFLDKRFAVKARLTGILVTIVGLLKKYQEDYEKLSIILRLLQSVASNSMLKSSPPPPAFSFLSPTHP